MCWITKSRRLHSEIQKFVVVSGSPMPGLLAQSYDSPPTTSATCPQESWLSGFKWKHRDSNSWPNLKGNALTTRLHSIKNIQRCENGISDKPHVGLIYGTGANHTCIVAYNTSRRTYLGKYTFSLLDESKYLHQYVCRLMVNACDVE